MKSKEAKSEFDFEEVFTEYELSQIREAMKQEAIAYAEWKSKLTPTQLCTVHPPAGSGSGIGLYHKTDDDNDNDYYLGL